MEIIWIEEGYTIEHSIYKKKFNGLWFQCLLARSLRDLLNNDLLINNKLSELGVNFEGDVLDLVCFLCKLYKCTPGH